jgi:hypothetical protein
MTRSRKSTYFLIALLAVATITVPRAQGETLVPAWSQIEGGIAVIGYEKADGTFVTYGTGFCIESNATTSEFVTADHVVTPPTSSAPVHLVVMLAGSKSATAAIVKQSPQNDLALVSAPLGNVTVLHMSATPAAAGQEIALGAYPYSDAVLLGGLFGPAQMAKGQKANLAPTVEMGSVSGVQNSLIEFDVSGGAVEHGTGGAPLLDPQTGAVYGVVEGFLAGSTANLAISASTVSAFLAAASP